MLIVPMQPSQAPRTAASTCCWCDAYAISPSTGIHTLPLLIFILWWRLQGKHCSFPVGSRDLAQHSGHGRRALIQSTTWCPGTELDLIVQGQHQLAHDCFQRAAETSRSDLGTDVARSYIPPRAAQELNVAGILGQAQANFVLQTKQDQRRLAEDMVSEVLL